MCAFSQEVKSKFVVGHSVCALHCVFGATTEKLCICHDDCMKDSVLYLLKLFTLHPPRLDAYALRVADLASPRQRQQLRKWRLRQMPRPLRREYILEKWRDCAARHGLQRARQPMRLCWGKKKFMCHHRSFLFEFAGITSFSRYHPTGGVGSFR